MALTSGRTFTLSTNASTALHTQLIPWSELWVICRNSTSGQLSSGLGRFNYSWRIPGNRYLKAAQVWISKLMRRTRRSVLSKQGAHENHKIHSRPVGSGLCLSASVFGPGYSARNLSWYNSSPATSSRAYPGCLAGDIPSDIPNGDLFRRSANFRASVRGGGGLDSN